MELGSGDGIAKIRASDLTGRRVPSKTESLPGGLCWTFEGLGVGFPVERHGVILAASYARLHKSVSQSGSHNA